MWMAGELLEAIVTPTTKEEEEQRPHLHETIDSISSLLMSGFGIFLIVRFFWLRKAAALEARL